MGNENLFKNEVCIQSTTKKSVLRRMWLLVLTAMMINVYSTAQNLAESEFIQLSYLVNAHLTREIPQSEVTNQSLYDFTFNACDAQITALWDMGFAVISAAEQTIDGASSNEDKIEARLMRIYALSVLYDYFKYIPLSADGSTLTPSDTENFIISEADWLIANSPAALNNYSPKYSAMMLKARILLKQKNYASALMMLLEIVNSGTCTLLAAFDYDSWTQPSNIESIWKGFYVGDFNKKSDQQAYSYPIRNVETYLMLVECYAETGQIMNANQYINDLRTLRSLAPVSLNTPGELLAECDKQWVALMSKEGFRYAYLNRRDMLFQELPHINPVIHSMLPIPGSAIENNPHLTQNPGYGSCSSTIAVTGVSLDKTTASLTVGGTEQLTATIAPGNASNQNVYWSSSDSSIVATVSSTGLVTAIGAGTSTITVRTEDGNKTATCVVTVTPAPQGQSWKLTPTMTATLVDGVLTISTTIIEPMPYLSYLDYQPWHDLRNEIQSVVVRDSVTSIGRYAFRELPITSVSISDSVKRIDDSAFSGCGNLASVTLPNSITSIGLTAFEYCTKLAGITIPNSVTTIDGWAFQACTSLTSITIPNSVTTMGSHVFRYCTGLKSATILNAVIENHTFLDCSSLESVTISKAVTKIGGNAFQACNNLTSVTVEWPTPLDVSNLEIFYDVNLSKAALYVPAGTKTLYTNAAVWKDFGIIMEDGSPDISVTAEDERLGHADEGSLTLNFAVAEDERIGGSFELVLPEGMTLDLDATGLVDEPSLGISMTVNSINEYTYLFNFFYADSRSSQLIDLRNASVSTYVPRPIVRIAYKISNTLPSGHYDVVINNLSIETEGGTKIEQDKLTITLNISSPTSNVMIDKNNTSAYVSNGILYVESAFAETIRVYSINGTLLYTFQKPAGKANYVINKSNGMPVLVVGSSGWSQKVVLY